MDVRYLVAHPQVRVDDGDLVGVHQVGEQHLGQGHPYPRFDLLAFGDCARTQGVEAVGWSGSSLLRRPAHRGLGMSPSCGGRLACGAVVVRGEVLGVVDLLLRADSALATGC